MHVRVTNRKKTIQKFKLVPRVGRVGGNVLRAVNEALIEGVQHAELYCPK